MLSKQELEKSPLFHGIQYEEYLRMLTCFQAVQKSFRADDLIYDFSDPGNNAVGIIERGNAALIRIDEEGVSTVMEDLGAGGVFGRTLRLPEPDMTVWRLCAVHPVMCYSLTILIF